VDVWPTIVKEEAAGRIGFDLAAWRALPISLQRSTLREAIHRLRWSLRDISFVHVEDALAVARDGYVGQRATLPQGLLLTVGYDRLTVAGADAAEALPDWPLLCPDVAPVSVSVPGCTLLPGSGWMLVTELVDRRRLPTGWDANPDPWLSYLDGSAAARPLWLRSRRAGDRFRPMGMHGHEVKLADWLTNRKVPRRVRARLPLLVGEEEILCVCGQRLDERARLLEGTAQVLVLRFVRS
jgi:tRNA(Ile)-lysidine synthase